MTTREILCKELEFVFDVFDVNNFSNFRPRGVRLIFTDLNDNKAELIVRFAPGYGEATFHEREQKQLKG